MTKGEEEELNRVVSRLCLVVTQLERKVERLDEAETRLTDRLDALGSRVGAIEPS